MMSRLRRAPVLVALSLIPAAATLAAEAIPVAVATVERQPVRERIVVNGTVTSPQIARLSVSVDALVESVTVEEGDHVDAGDPLLTLDAELARRSLESARAAVLEVEQQAADARRRASEAERLAEERSIAETQRKTLLAEAAAAEARVERLRAEARRWAALVERHRLAAPFAGVVSAKLVEVGEWVSPGDAVLELVSMEGLRMDFRVPQQHYASIGPDTPVRVRSEGVAESIPARIRARVPVAESDARTFLLRVVPEGEPALLPGMAARAELDLAAGREGLVVPRDALLRYPDGRVGVWVVQGSGDDLTVTERMVEVGLTFGSVAEVRTGLEAGQRVVTRGNEALVEDQHVRIVSGD